MSNQRANSKLVVKTKPSASVSFCDSSISVEIDPKSEVSPAKSVGFKMLKGSVARLGMNGVVEKIKMEYAESVGPLMEILNSIAEATYDCKTIEDFNEILISVGLNIDTAVTECFNEYAQDIPKGARAIAFMEDIETSICAFSSSLLEFLMAALMKIFTNKPDLSKKASMYFRSLSSLQTKLFQIYTKFWKSAVPEEAPKDVIVREISLESSSSGDDTLAKIAKKPLFKNKVAEIVEAVLNDKQIRVSDFKALTPPHQHRNQENLSKVEVDQSREETKTYPEKSQEISIKHANPSESMKITSLDVVSVRLFKEDLLRCCKANVNDTIEWWYEQVATINTRDIKDFVLLRFFTSNEIKLTPDDILKVLLESKNYANLIFPYIYLINVMDSISYANCTVIEIRLWSSAEPKLGRIFGAKRFLAQLVSEASGYEWKVSAVQFKAKKSKGNDSKAGKTGSSKTRENSLKGKGAQQKSNAKASSSQQLSQDLRTHEYNCHCQRCYNYWTGAGYLVVEGDQLYNNRGSKPSKHR